MTFKTNVQDMTLLRDSAQRVIVAQIKLSAVMEES